MTTADWALIISLCSLLLSLAGFVWSVWSKFIFPKPKIELSFNVMQTFGGFGNGTDLFVLSVTNFGPAENVIKMAVIRDPASGIRRRRRLGILNPLHNFPAQQNHSIGPFSGGLPKKMAVGEEFSLYFPYNAGSALATVDRVGVVDTFGRYHWCSRKQMQRVRKRFRADFTDTAAAKISGAPN